jgi:hypothetical protein
MTMTLQEAERRAREITGGVAASPAEALDLEKVLRGGRKFGLARKILERIKDHADVVRDPKLRLKVAQKLSLCTYKDADLPADQKLDDAERVLQAADDLKTTTDQETLGLAGAIHKRKWELTAQERYLETSLAYYFRGYQQGVAKDYGYTGINAAFVLDVLSDLENVESQPAPLVAATAAQRRALAKRIRMDIVEALADLPNQPGNAWLKDTWWFLVTLGDAYFGLDDCKNAEKWLMQAAALRDVPDWEQESTARQLAALLRVKENIAKRGGPKVDPCLPDVLRKFLGRSSAAMDSVVRGKVGLGLSGGGFRASLYHIGVLAKLAELDLLRHVEYLSCVSGGSIVGAHFYLEVRHLLQQKPDAEITRQDYIDIVGRIETDFFEGVKTNIRTQIAAEWFTNLKLIFAPAYSRTKRAGELYERHIYARVKDGHGHGPRWLNELKVQPKGEPDGFSPKDNNWRRAAKVPILVLNATSLNTGHNGSSPRRGWASRPPTSTRRSMRTIGCAACTTTKRRCRIRACGSASGGGVGLRARHFRAADARELIRAAGRKGESQAGGARRRRRLRQSRCRGAAGARLLGAPGERRQRTDGRQRLPEQQPARRSPSSKQHPASARARQPVRSTVGPPARRLAARINVRPSQEGPGSRVGRLGRYARAVQGAA